MIENLQSRSILSILELILQRVPLLDMEASRQLHIGGGQCLRGFIIAQGIHAGHFEPDRAETSGRLRACAA